jgi:5-methylcytosine-specific restriction endonuclease McrA
MIKYFIQLPNGELTECLDNEQAMRFKATGNKIIKLNRVITESKKRDILKNQDYKCNICGDPIHYEYEIDHIHPLKFALTYKNGFNNINELANLQALCKNCNRVKGSRLDFNVKIDTPLFPVEILKKEVLNKS